MSVRVEQLVKIYGKQKAVNNISFEAKKGEILGFLGPNGAGKSTSMKIISCYIPQTEGQVEVCGFNTLKDPMAVRQHIGYLPEHNPLYLDMYVKEYLMFAAKTQGLGNKSRERVQTMIATTGLEREQKKRIGQLSKGYRQRVGLAQAMIHDPQVLILDEPTSGLDPNQLAEIRSVIKSLGQEKTVILSTHIMQEVQALCDRVVIINEGKLVANDTIAELQQRTLGRTNIIVEFSEPIAAERLLEIPGVSYAKAVGSNDNKAKQQIAYHWTLTSNTKEDIRADIFNFAVNNQLTLLTLQQSSSSIEDVFRKLTQRN